jgi:DNA-binding response OmpR family regulator
MKALVAEDDLYTLEALKAILEGEGWSVVPCGDGAIAAQSFVPGAFDLVCLDVMMGGLSGYDVCRHIRKTDQRVPVLFISAKSEEIDKVLGLELGADDFVVKPFGVREVLARVHALVRRNRPGEVAAIDSPASPSGPLLSRTGTSGKAGSAPDAWTDSDPMNPENQPFVFGPWQILPLELRAMKLLDAVRDNNITKSEQRVDLLLREVSMLRLLVSRPGQAISRAQFFRACWDLENPPLSRTLDQHIVQLRKKLEDQPGRPRLIKTVQGVGYRYDPA